MSVQRFCQNKHPLTGMIAAWTCNRTQSAVMGRHIVEGWIGILAMALALTCARDCAACRSPHAAAPHGAGGHGKMLQRPAMPLHETLMILDEASESAAGSVSTCEGDVSGVHLCDADAKRLLRARPV